MNTMESDIEEFDEDNDLPDDRAWGQKAKNFYSSDYKYTDYTSATQQDLINAELEEQEAKKLQIRAAQEIFDIVDDRFTQITKDNKDDYQDDEVVKLNKSSQKRVLQQESKAYTILINDFKECITEVKQTLLPFIRMVEKGIYPDCDVAVFIKTKYQVVLNYCINISFFLMLKAQGLSLQSHPVVKRLEQYRQLLGQLKSLEGNLLEEIAEIIKTVKEGKPLYNISTGSEELIKQKASSLANINKRLASQKAMRRQKSQSLSDRADINSMNDQSLSPKELNDDESKEGVAILDTTNEEGKRAVTYEMIKNRGLTPYRRKDLRNPRVKHRNKYRKALIRRKGAVREVRKELTRYAGEISGIKAGVKKGIKLK